MSVVNPLNSKPPLLKNIHNIMQLKKLKKDKETSYTIKKICDNRINISKSIPDDLSHEMINVVDYSLVKDS